LPEIEPFAAVRYRASGEELAALIAPPYDVISSEHVARLRARHAHNVVRLILRAGEDAAGYDEVGRTYGAWLEQGILGQDPEPALFLLEQVFTVDGACYRRRGMLARFRAEDPGGSILPHEHTRAAAKEDRFQVLRATRANFSPIFLCFPDQDGAFSRQADAVATGAATVSLTDEDGVALTLWRIASANTIGEFTRLFAATRAYIADGHHRHATALRLRDSEGPDSAWTLGYFCPLNDPGLLVLPYHRILRSGPNLTELRAALESRLRVTEIGDPAQAAKIVAQSKAAHAYAFVDPQAAAGLLVESAAPPPDAESAPPCLRALDTFFLHQTVLQRLLGLGDDAVEFVHSPEEIPLRRPKLAIYMRATEVRQIVAVADARESMPAKSTFFHPKLPSGLVIHPLKASARK
jgi:uncharacterized protein (DUF1015 family)